MNVSSIITTELYIITRPLYVAKPNTHKYLDICSPSMVSEIVSQSSVSVGSSISAKLSILAYLTIETHAYLLESVVKVWAQLKSSSQATPFMQNIGAR